MVVGQKEEFDTESGRINYNKLKKILPNEKWIKIKKKEDIVENEETIIKAGVIVDALLGIGVKGEPREPLYSVIELINKKYSDIIVSIDIPSGYNPSRESKVFIDNPSIIVSFVGNKIKTSDFPKSTLMVKDIGTPKEAASTVGLGDIKWFFPHRAEDSHKRQNGVVTVIGGSEHYIGAPALSALGALRTGADLVYLLVPQTIRPIIASYYPDFITIEAKGDSILPSSVASSLNDERLRESTFVIGPGMKNEESTRNCLLELLQSNKRLNIVVDAGALTVIDESILNKLSTHQTILTPHRAEFKALSAIELSDDIEENKEIVLNFAKKWGTTILLKGQTDIISNKNYVKINKTGHSGMTVGGTGDVLTGIVASIFSVTNSPFTSAYLGAYICGKAGSLAAKHYGVGLIASDIPNYIYSAIYEGLSFKAKEI